MQEAIYKKNSLNGPLAKEKTKEEIIQEISQQELQARKLKENNYAVKKISK